MLKYLFRPKVWEAVVLIALIPVIFSIFVKYLGISQLYLKNLIISSYFIGIPLILLYLGISLELFILDALKKKKKKRR